MHAEMDVLRFAKPGDVLEVMRFFKNSDKMTMAKPCCFCESEIRNAKIKSVRYTNWDGNWVTMKI
jgi:deoxycytidylate deaminase